MPQRITPGLFFRQFEPVHQPDRVRDLERAAYVGGIAGLGGHAQEPAPAPAPAPAPPVAAALEPALFVIEEFQLYTVNGDVGFLQPPVDTIVVPGNSTKTTYVHKSVTKSFEAAFSSSALETTSESSSSALSEGMKEASATDSATDKFDYQLDSSVRVRGEVGLNSFKGSGQLNAKTSSTAVHNAVTDSVEKAVQKQAMATKSAASQQSVEVNNSQAVTSAEDRVETLVIDNSKNDDTLNYVICRLAVEKVTCLCLVNVRLGLYNAREKKLYEYRLNEIDDLLRCAIESEEHRAELREKLTAWLLKPVFDTNGEPRRLVEEREYEGTKYLHVNKDIETSVAVKRSGGEDKVLEVPGIALNDQYRVMPTDTFGAAVLRSS